MDAIRGKRKLKNKGGRKKRGDPAPGVLRGKTDKPNHLARPLKQQKAPQQTASYLTAHWGHYYLSICNYPNSQAVGSSSADCECLTAPWNHFYLRFFCSLFPQAGESSSTDCELPHSPLGPSLLERPVYLLEVCIELLPLFSLHFGSLRSVSSTLQAVATSPLVPHEQLCSHWFTGATR
jgi:hypothetical protein